MRILKPVWLMRIGNMAEWIKDNRTWFTPGGDPVWICSNCGGGTHVFGIESTESQPKICPDCGEKMTNAIEIVWLDDVTRTWRR